MILGIDLGTTNSAIAIMEGSQPKILENLDGARTTASVVSFKDGDILVGQQAKNQIAVNPDTFVSIKSHMGELGYTVKAGGQEYRPEDISSEILKYLKNVAEKYSGNKITEAVITVPAYFNDDQRTATKKAGELAGLNVKRVLNEPTSAALAYANDKELEDDIVMVYDLGGGTFDVSILKLDTDLGIYEVLSTNGNNQLGGDDFDAALVAWANKKISDEIGEDFTQLPIPMGMVDPQFRLKEEAEKAKKALSSAESYHFTVPFLSMIATQPINFDATISKSEFNTLITPLVQQTKKPIEKALELANLTYDDIDIVLMNGGSTRVPLVQNYVMEITGKEPNFSVNPDEAVAVGAVIYGEAVLEEPDNVAESIDLIDVTSLALGVGVVGDRFSTLIQQNSSLPAIGRDVYVTNEDNQTHIKLEVAQGESAVFSENYKLGELMVEDIPPMPAHNAKIEVTFQLDLDGIISIEVEDLQTGKITRGTINKNATAIDA